MSVEVRLPCRHCKLSLGLIEHSKKRVKSHEFAHLPYIDFRKQYINFATNLAGDHRMMGRNAFMVGIVTASFIAGRAMADSLDNDVFVFCEPDEKTLTVELALAWTPDAPAPITERGKRTLAGRAAASSSVQIADRSNPRQSPVLRHRRVSEFICAVPYQIAEGKVADPWLRAKAVVREEAGNSNPDGRCGAADIVSVELTWEHGAPASHSPAWSGVLINTCDFRGEDSVVQKIILDLTSGEAIAEFWPTDKLP